MRVALDATPLLGNRTGVATFTDGLLRALAARADVDVHAFALSARGGWNVKSHLPPGVAASRRPLPAGLLTRVWRHADWPTAELAIGANADVVHGTNYVAPPSSKAATVVTVYDLTAVRFPEMVEPASLRYPDLVRRAVARGAFVHVTANSVAEEVVDLLAVPRDRVRVIASGLDEADEGDPASGRRIAGATRFVLALGTVEPRKGLPDLVAAFDTIAASGAHHDVHLVIAGPDGWGADDLVRAIDASPHRRRIRRLGRVTDAARADLLAGATVFAMPSRYEGFGYPPLEAMAAGTAVVATTAGSLPEVLGDAAHLVEVGDVPALAAAVASLLDDDEARSMCVAAGRARVATYSWETCAAAMVELYRDAMSAMPAT